MSKRSPRFERRPRDFYQTPVEAIPALAAHLPPQFTFAEPCAGDGTLIRHLEAIGGHCVAAYDIAPRHDGVQRADALRLSFGDMKGARYVITNPPWSRPVLGALISHYAAYTGDVWFLFYGDWPHTQWAAPLMKSIRKIVSVGRLQWIPGSKCSGMDNVAWYQISSTSATATQFFGRAIPSSFPTPPTGSAGSRGSESLHTKG